MSQYKYFKSGIINRSSQYQKKKQLIASNYKSTMEFIDFILVNCCLILNIKSVKKKAFCRWKFSNVLLAKYYTT
jgi:hypothetical protein